MLTNGTFTSRISTSVLLLAKLLKPFIYFNDLPLVIYQLLLLGLNTSIPQSLQTVAEDNHEVSIFPVTVPIH